MGTENKEKTVTRSNKSASVSRSGRSKDEALEKVELRNEFCLEFLEGQKKQSLYLMIAIGVVTLALIIALSLKDEVRVIAIDNEGRIIEPVALNDPFVSNAFITNWVATKGVELYSYGFNNYVKHFQELSSDFTKRGWVKFSEAMKASNNLLLVKEDNVIVSSVPISAPVIEMEGPYGDRYAWRVSFDMLITYEGSTERRTQKINFTAIVVRENLLEYPSGIAIEQTVSKDI